MNSIQNLTASAYVISKQPGKLTDNDSMVARTWRNISLEISCNISCAAHFLDATITFGTVLKVRKYHRIIKILHLYVQIWTLRYQGQESSQKQTQSMESIWTHGTENQNRKNTQGPGGSRTPVSSASLFLAYQASRCSKSRKKLRKGSIHPSPQPQSQSSCHQLPFASILPNMAFRIRVFSCIRWTVTKHSGTLVNWLELNAQGFSFSCSCRSFSSRSWEGKKDAFAPAGNIQLAPLSPASRSRLSRAYCSMRSFSACSSASSFLVCFP